MKSIQLKGVIGDQDVTVELTQPNGSGDLYHIMVDRYYNGMIVKRNGEWAVFLNENSKLSSEDVEVILEAVRE